MQQAYVGTVHPYVAAKKIQTLLNALDSPQGIIKGISGNLQSECEGFLEGILAQLRFEGWRVTINTGTATYEVLPPQKVS